jgi:hypothetical protein
MARGEHHAGRGQHPAAAHREAHHPREPSGRGEVAADHLTDRLGAVAGPGCRFTDGEHAGEHCEYDQRNDFPDHLDI